MNPSGEDGEAGMTLVEVLVAFAILTLVSLAMFRTFGEGVRRTALAQAAQTRMEVGQSVIAAALARGRFPAASSGESEGVRWFLEARPLESPGGTKAAVPVLLRLRLGSPDAPPFLQTVAAGLPE